MPIEFKCWICGQPASKSFYEHWLLPGEETDNDDGFVTPAEKIKELKGKTLPQTITSRMYCDKCFSEEQQRLQTEKERFIILKKHIMFERALRILERQDIDMYEYRNLIIQFQIFIDEDPTRFDSAYEIVAAIILADNEIKCSTQYKIGGYRVDFYIPELKIILEIDGESHKNTLFKDNQRDIAIRKILGDDWETIRIGTEYLKNNAELLVEAIKTLKNEKQSIRRKNNGFLPEWYSKRDKAVRTRSFKVGDDHLFGI